jgi:hypothetical protein
VLALSARSEQGATATATSATPAPTYLLQRMAANRWCSSSKSYSAQLNGNMIVWRDNLGSIDVESINSNNQTDAQTTTQKSFHPDGKSEDIGTLWFYHQLNAEKVHVRSSDNKSFYLSRC